VPHPTPFDYSVPGSGRRAFRQRTDDSGKASQQLLTYEAGVGAWRNERRAHFHGVIDAGLKKQAVPVDHLRPVGPVGDLDRDRPAFLQTQQWTGNLAVVGGGVERVRRRELGSEGRDL
jgi:hypothetical protein